MREVRAILIVSLAALAPSFAFGQMPSEDCLACHSDDALTMESEGREVSVHVDPERFSGSVHSFLSCADCHADIAEYPHEPRPAPVSCDSCHPDSVEAHRNSIHGRALDAGNGRVPTCASCHGNPHTILPSSDPESKTAHRNIPDTCGSCHGVQFVMEPSGFSVRPFFNYQESVHGRALAAGEERAAVCTDCHDYHDIRTPREADSPINKFNIPETCGKCHGEESAQFVESVHGTALARGVSASPSCTDCHGIHNIKPHIDPTSSVSFQSVARTTCSQCHGGVRLTEEFGVAGRRVGGYEGSYHGLASRLGSNVVANCASCHGVHDILPSSNPESMIHPANLRETCGTCHPGATDAFARARVHWDVAWADDIGSKVTWWIQTFYIWMIVLVIGGMILHNLIVWIRKVRAAKNRPGRVVPRMNRNERIQHMVNLVAFLVLAISGFALAWPESWLGSAFVSESVRRWIHRVAAIAMMGVGVWHLAYMFGTPQGRRGLRDFLPRWKDVADLRQMIVWMLGRGPRPKFERFGYAEKAEYWALIWGTLVMSVTGLMLWFKVWFGSLLEGWWIDVALVIHFWEAVLATLAIVVWHFYHVIFDPDVYPMNFSWLDGTMSEQMYHHEHALDYERWRREQEPESGADEEP